VISKFPQEDVDPLLLFDYRCSAEKENPEIFENTNTVY